MWNQGIEADLLIRNHTDSSFCVRLLSACWRIQLPTIPEKKRIEFLQCLEFLVTSMLWFL